ncbi:MAG: hypothetical protein IPM51_15890 [Sphingobacteriaceae bacterium]|nr:hypothetical protein [Sphingobacteriaceae bacterium]
MQDSIRKIKDQLRVEVQFLGTQTETERINHEHKFPYIYLNILAITVLLCVWLIIKNNK